MQIGKLLLRILDPFALSSRKAQKFILDACVSDLQDSALTVLRDVEQDDFLFDLTLWEEK